MSDRTLRFLVANPGQAQDRDVKVVARTLADAGHEVVYAGIDQTPEMIAAAAVQEAVDAVALVSEPMPAVSEALAARGASDVPVKAFTAAVTPAEILHWVHAALTRVA